MPGWSDCKLKTLGEFKTDGGVSPAPESGYCSACNRLQNNPINKTIIMLAINLNLQRCVETIFKKAVAQASSLRVCFENETAPWQTTCLLHYFCRVFYIELDARNHHIHGIGAQVGQKLPPRKFNRTGKLPLPPDLRLLRFTLICSIHSKQTKSVQILPVNSAN